VLICVKANNAMGFVRVACCGLFLLFVSCSQRDHPDATDVKRLLRDHLPLVEMPTWTNQYPVELLGVYSSQKSDYFLAGFYVLDLHAHGLYTKKYIADVLPPEAVSSGKWFLDESSTLRLRTSRGRLRRSRQESLVVVRLPIGGGIYLVGGDTNSSVWRAFCSKIPARDLDETRSNLYALASFVKIARAETGGALGATRGSDRP
jgi:hypothetical protein